MPESIRVAIDGTPLLGPIGGIRRFTDQLLLALRASFPDDRFIPLSDQFLPLPTGIDRRWWLVGLNRALRRVEADVFHGTDFAVPYIKRLPCVLTVHDLSPWRMPTPASERVRKRCGALLRLRIPDFVHTPSETVRRELIEHFGYPEDRVVAIPLAAAAHLEPGEPSQGEPYFLCAGTLEPRKNLDVLVAAAKLFPCRVLLAGQLREGYEVPAGPGVEWVGAPDEAELAKLYRNAIAVLYPSRYEGFGLPVLEAMQCGAPVIASRIAVLEEVGGDAALYAAPDSPEEWASAMQLLWCDGELRRLQSVQGLARAKQYSWEKTATAFRHLYGRCLHES